MQRNCRGLKVIVLVDVELAEILVVIIVEEDPGVIIIVVIIVIIIDAIFPETIGKIVAETGCVVVIIVVIIVELGGERLGIDFRRVIDLIAIAVIIVGLGNLLGRLVLFDSLELGFQARVFTLWVELGFTLRAPGRPAAKIIEFGAAAGAGALASQFRLGHGIPT
jgi:hypothetical protein